MDYLDKLNPQQKAPVEDTEGAVLVLAGAGSGKTRVLTNRIAYLIENKGVAPQNILAITFTNKAANEMRERLISMIKEGSNCWVSTIHSMCVRILRMSIDKLEGFNTNFTIYSESEKEHVLKKIIADMKITSDNFLKNAKFHISNAKNSALSPDDYRLENPRAIDIDRYVQVYKAYQESLKNSNAVDFDDLLVLTYRLLSENQEVLEYYADRFHYVHVDEFQDTNKIQYDIIKMLVSKHNNIFVVGDDDQSIYGWRGAEIKNILNFHKDFKNSKVYKLEQNYRSTKRILDLANSVIKNNRERSQKELWTENGEGAKVETFFADEEGGEASYTAMTIRRLVNDGASFSDFAVLMRINAISRAYEQEFTKYGIPFKIYGGFKFFERKEIKDLTAYMRILSNPLDDEAILRIINTPKRGIGDKTIETLIAYAKENGFMIFDALIDAEKLGLPAGAKSKIISFKKLIVSLMADKETMNMTELFDSIVNKTAFLTQFEEKNSENNDKLMNVNELKNSIDEFQKINPNSGLNEYLSSITLSTDMDDASDGSYVTVATIHSVKGLEFNTVFISGMDENIFPSSRAIGDPSEMEEERRLLYVAITRAEQKLYITRAKSRFLYGSRQITTPSRFLNEMAEKLGIVRPSMVARSVENENLYGVPKYSSETYVDNSSDINASKTYGVTSNFSRSFNRKPFENKPASKAVSGYKAGAKVRHAKFGVGTVISVKNSGSNVIADIAFPNLGVKSFAVSLAPMEVIG